MEDVIVVTTHVVKSPEIFDSDEFINDIASYRQDVFSTPGCLSVKVLKETLIPPQKFYFISHWVSIDALTPFLNQKYSRHMQIFKKKFLSSMDVSMTCNFFPKLKASDTEEKYAQLKRDPIETSMQHYQKPGLIAILDY